MYVKLGWTSPCELSFQDIWAITFTRKRCAGIQILPTYLQTWVAVNNMRGRKNVRKDKSVKSPRPQSKHAHRDRGVGERVLWGRADHWWNPPCRAGTRTATSRKLTDMLREKRRKAVQSENGQNKEARRILWKLFAQCWSFIYKLETHQRHSLLPLTSK